MSDAAALGMHCAAVLAAHPGERLSAGWIAKRLRVSEAHLAKVLRRLGRAGLVESRRGPRGGFSLAVPARRLSLLRVYEAVEGPIRAEGCLLGAPACRHGDRCIMGGLLCEAAELLRNHLAGTKVSDLAGLFGEE